MANIFRKKDSYIDRVNRSTFDLSFVNNLTMKFGAITPVCLLPASFGDSFQINARFNLQLLPTVFPIQTQLYVRLHFVYVRTRTLWEDWMSFFGGDETVTPPWVDPTAEDTVQGHKQFNVLDDLQTGSLADYLGVPTTITGTYGATSEVNRSSDITSEYTSYRKKWLVGSRFNGSAVSFSEIHSYITSDSLQTPGQFLTDFPATGDSLPSGVTASVLDFGGISFGSVPSLKATFDLSVFGSNAQEVARNLLILYFPSGLSGTLDSWDCLTDNYYNLSGKLSLKGSTLEFTAPTAPSSDSCLVVLYPTKSVGRFPADSFYLTHEGTGAEPTTFSYLSSSVPSFLLNTQVVSTDVSWTKPEALNCPFYTPTSKLPAIPLSALPFRAYEAYYNAFGRDIRNNPFIVDGKPEYNKYVPSLKGGSDTYKYQLHYANWEPDAYTTALQSPQAGVAPLVGITSLGEATFRDAVGTEYRAQLETAEDGDTVTGFQIKSSNAPADVVRNLIGMATSGISISDFRNVNSLQRFLEIRVRQSPRYKNLVKGLFDVNLDYDELMMPEFLGGISDTIPIYKVTQTTPTEGNPLGSFAGQGSLQSGMRHVIRKYCPEDGYILGVMSVVPAANYSQLLAPHFTRMNLLDWHFPQFNNISYQPMLYKHLCPYQAYSVNPVNINNVFGYQRAYWDLISSFDEVHGEFRGSMRNFLINRVFDKAPELSKDFLLVNPDHVNDVFAMTAENGDKILGSVAFDITKKTTIPRNSIPHIE